jgi:DNA topoisomerase-3
VIEGKWGYGCANWREADGGCRFVIAKDIQGKRITPILLARILGKKRIGPLNGFYDEQGHPFDGFLELKQSQGAWSVELSRSRKPVAKSLSPQAIGQCPACGGEIVEGNKGYGCANWREEDGGCRFVIWKTIAQKPISAALARTLLTQGGTERLEGFCSRKGNRFSARLKLERNGRGLKVGFDFDG